MELLTLIAVVILAGLVLFKFKEVNTVPATSDDWYVIFDIDANYKILSLWFYPVVAISGVWYEAKAISSNPSETKRLQKARKEEKFNDGAFGHSFSYGRWYRDGVSIDEQGKPEVLSSDSFAAYVAGFLVEEFTIRHATPVPIKFQYQFDHAHQLAERKSK